MSSSHPLHGAPASLTHEIAATAARLVVEEGLDWGHAKRRALRQLGAPARTPLPDNTLLEAEVRAYIALFCADTQPAELAALRQTALDWMQRLAEFRPHLSGPVWNGTATRLSDIHLQLFCDDPKSAEIALIDQRIDYDPQRITGFNGAEVDVLSFTTACPGLGEPIGVHLMIHDLDDLRGALKPGPQGQPLRGDRDALLRKMAQEAEQKPQED